VAEHAKDADIGVGDALTVFPDRNDPLKLKHRVLLDPELRSLLMADDVTTDKSLDK